MKILISLLFLFLPFPLLPFPLLPSPSPFLFSLPKSSKKSIRKRKNSSSEPYKKHTGAKKEKKSSHQPGNLAHDLYWSGVVGGEGTCDFTLFEDWSDILSNKTGPVFIVQVGFFLFFFCFCCFCFCYCCCFSHFNHLNKVVFGRYNVCLLTQNAEETEVWSWGLSSDFLIGCSLLFFLSHIPFSLSLKHGHCPSNVLYSQNNRHKKQQKNYQTSKINSRISWSKGKIYIFFSISCSCCHKKWEGLNCCSFNSILFLFNQTSNIQ